MKKIASLLMIVAMICSAAFAHAEQADPNLIVMPGFEQVTDPVSLQPGTHITVGLTTPMSGMFGSELFGNNTADMDVRALIHGYSTIAWTQTHGMALDGNVVASVDTTQSPRGNRVYTLSLQDDLYYNNGQKITAKDYVFSLLLNGSPAVREIGGTPAGRANILGYDAYAGGAASAIAGVRLLSDESFSIEVVTDGKPFFYGYVVVLTEPMPVSVIAPGCDIVDDAAGAKIVASAEAAAMDAAALGFTPGEFGAAMLMKTLLDPETGYATNPRVTCGPYSLVSYDKEKHIAEFTVNPYYTGNYEGQKPHIERITFQPTTNETMIDELMSGELTLVNKVANADSIERGIAAAQGQTAARFVSYPRTGFTFLSFACELGPTSSNAVRLAIAHTIDKRAFANEMIASPANPATVYGLPVYGYYGIGQWMYNQRFEENAETGLAAVDTAVFVETLETKKDMQLAESLLVGDGWTLNESGEAFQTGVDAVRYRKEGDALVPLTIKWAMTEDSVVAQKLRPILEEALPLLGIGLEITTMPFSDMMMHYYRQTEREYNMFFLASNFYYVFDPYYDFHTDDAYQGVLNRTGIRDEQLMLLGRDLRETAPNDMHGYLIKWQALQQRFAEVMPVVPLYCNLYFDFYAPTLQGYNIVANTGWSLAIPYAYVADAPIEAAP